MTVTAAVEKKEKSLAEMLIVIVLVAVMMSSFIYYFFKHQQQVVSTGFESLANVFTARVNGIRGQWFMEGQPKAIFELGQMDPSKAIEVNDKGWVASTRLATGCQDIWHAVMSMPLSYMNQPIAALLVMEGQLDGRFHCRFVLENGLYFTYRSDNGQVSRVMAN